LSAEQPVDGPDAAQDVGRVGTLLAAGLEPTPVTAAVQDGVEKAPLSRASDEAGAEFTQDGAIEAGIGQFKGKGVLPVNAGADGVGRLSVGEILGELEDGD
jgi:hypothetical protein